MLNNGFSEAIGSCRIMAIIRPRIWRISREDFWVSSSPWKVMRPPATRAELGSKPTIERQVVVLPQPDSPIRPRVSPSFRLKLMPSTALTTRLPPKVVKCVCSSETSRSGVMATNSSPSPCGRGLGGGDTGAGTAPPPQHPPPRGGGGVPATPSQIPLLRIEPDAQPVAEQLRRQHDQQNAETGEDGEPPVAHHQHGTAI